ncbi:hypothetical protein C5167_029451 [Papaver somniferum]|nr:hypothetical protein C5167_029451 [Papaver somniferum]
MKWVLGGNRLRHRVLEMDSEISRRILATTKYVSYEALKKNTTPCSKKGASYYNCKFIQSLPYLFVRTKTTNTLHT